MKILILRFSSIGDIVLTTPVIRALKNQIQNLELHYATKSIYEDVLSQNPYLDQIHVLKDSIFGLIRELRQEKFDLIIDLHNNLRTSIIKRALNVPSRSYRKYNFEKWIFTNLKQDRMPKNHVVDRFMDTVAHLGVKTDEGGLDFTISEKDEVEMEWLPKTYRDGFVGVLIGGKFATKRLPKDRLIELCDRINKPIVLIGGKDVAEVGEEVASFFERKTGYDRYAKGLESMGKKAIVFNACGKFNVGQSASLVKQARWIFCHDTGFMHIAAAFKKEIYSIWGNTVPEFGMYPYRTKFTIFENKKLSCRPCSKIGYENCPKGHFKCMKEVNFDFYLPD